MAVERPSTQQRVMFTSVSKMSWVQAATTENPQNAETEDENDQIVPIVIYFAIALGHLRSDRW